MPEEVAFAEGAVIYFENEPSGPVYILRSGRVDLARNVADSIPRQISPGEILGLAESVNASPRIGSARAVTNVTATAVEAEEFRSLLGNNVSIALKVVTSLCAELREIDELIVKRMRGGLISNLGRGQGLRMIADHFRRKNQTRAARYAYGRFLETGPKPEDRLEAALHLAMLCEKDGEIEVAHQIYGQLTQEFPDDARPQSAFNRLQEILNTMYGEGGAPGGAVPGDAGGPPA